MLEKILKKVKNYNGIMVQNMIMCGVHVIRDRSSIYELLILKL